MTLVNFLAKTFSNHQVVGSTTLRDICICSLRGSIRGIRVQDISVACHNPSYLFMAWVPSGISRRRISSMSSEFEDQNHRLQQVSLTSSKQTFTCTRYTEYGDHPPLGLLHQYILYYVTLHDFIVKPPSSLHRS